MGTLLILTAVFSWYIQDFSVSATLHKNGQLEVIENITVDFENERHHGIYRVIPTYFRNHPIDFKLITASNPTGAGRKYKVSRGYKVVNIRIGDKDTYVTGIQKYVISYKVKYVVFDSAGAQWLIWNVTGNQWGVPIKRASFSIIFDDIKGPVISGCFTGAYGETRYNCTPTCSSNFCTFKTTTSLGRYEGFTILIKFPPGSVAQPGTFTKIMWWFRRLWPLLIPIFTFFYMFFQWLKHGRDPKMGPVTPMYEPPEDVLPIEAGSIIDEKMDPRDLTAEIIDLALRGYIEIIETPDKKDYVLVRLKDITVDMNEVDRYLISSLFSVGSVKELLKKARKKARKDPEYAKFLQTINEHLDQGRDVIAISSLPGLSRRFYKQFNIIRKKVMRELTERGYFARNPQTIRTKYMGIATAISFGGFFIAFFLAKDFLVMMSMILASILTSAIIALFGSIMPRKTVKGARARWHLLGLKEFIKRVEEDRLKRFALENMEMFKKILPYAIVFKQEKKWAKVFEDIYKTVEERQRFAPTLHVSSFDLAVAGMSSAVGAAAPSGGHGGASGGFSGGGAGGGGGGAW